MDGHWRVLLGLSFSDCSLAERDVDRGRPTIKGKVLELANLLMKGYFRALYAPLGGSRIWREKASLISLKLCVSMFRDKPPCMPLYFSTVDYIARGGQGFFFFLSLYSSRYFFSFLDSTTALFPQLFLLSFLFPPVPVLSVFSFFL